MDPVDPGPVAEGETATESPRVPEAQEQGAKRAATRALIPSEEAPRAKARSQPEKRDLPEQGLPHERAVKRGPKLSAIDTVMQFIATRFTKSKDSQDGPLAEIVDMLRATAEKVSQEATEVELTSLGMDINETEMFQLANDIYNVEVHASDADLTGWKDADHSEFDSLRKFKVFKEVDEASVPDGHKVLPTRMVRTLKGYDGVAYDPSDKVRENKAKKKSRFVVKGYAERDTHGTTYHSMQRYLGRCQSRPF